MNNITYKESLVNAMTELGNREDAIFIGQQIVWAGNPMSGTLLNVPKEKMIEIPVMEDTQMGMTLGMSLSGKFVISFYPRWDFLICASNQLISHIDKIGLMSGGQWLPNIIIRVGKGSDTPIDPGHQHKGNYLEEYKSLCKNIEFHDLKTPGDIELSYKYATKEGGIHVLVEYPELY
jgi:pyruvate/2-oxoglutarate/acetoin dehydrogenase E1 component